MDDARKTNAQLLQNRALLSRRRARLEAAPRDTPAPGQRPLALVEPEHDTRYACVEAHTEQSAVSNTGHHPISDTAMSAIVTLNAHGVIEACSPATAHLFVSAVEALIGCPVTRLMPAASGAAYEGALAQYLRSGGPHSLGYTCLGRRQDGTTFPLFFVVSAVYQNNQRVLSGLVRPLVSAHPACSSDHRK